MNLLKRKIISLYTTSVWISMFAHIRFWTGSFEEIERLVPTSGTILDLGCGYGIFANYLGLSASNRKVIGVDLDRNKINRAPKKIKNVVFRYGDATRMNVSDLRGIILLDVLHHLGSYKSQEELIKKCALMLLSGGKLLIGEVDNTPIWKLPFARLVDFLLYPSQPVYYRYRKDLLSLLQRYFGHDNVKVINLHNNPFPHKAYICQKK